MVAGSVDARRKFTDMLTADAEVQVDQPPPQTTRCGGPFASPVLGNVTRTSMQQHPNPCQELRRSSQTQVVSSLPADGPGGHEV